MYGMVMPSTPTRFGAYVQVTSPEDLDSLIKESEVLGGHGGRQFIARLNDTTLEFRIAGRPGGYEVTAVASEECQGAPYFVGSGRQLMTSIVGQSMAFGRLFTAAI